jgi:2-polyprenyl-6-methoxyphenol hydroxylase-like FAD-dependent oxidoreductase
MSVPETPTNTQVCIIGGGPAGVIAAYLFALRGVSVVLLEGKPDFNREFRGDTLHASSLEILDQLGLADEVLQQANSKIENLSFTFPDKVITLADFSAMDTKFPYVGIIPQEKFLNHIVDKAKQFSNFTILMGAQVRELKKENGKVCGVRYFYEGNDHDLDATLTIGADGRGSSARRLAKIDLGKTSPPMDVVWFKLPIPADSEMKQAVSGRIGSGSMIVVINRKEYLQVGYIIMKGGYKALREQGIEHFHQVIKTLSPELAGVVTEIKDWSEMAILSVVTGRVEQWYRDGLILIGDAAHIMSPVGGVGINYAIQDAVATVNQLAGPLLEERLIVTDLAEVQKRREKAVSIIQGFQSFIQKRIIADALKSDKDFEPPLPMKIISKLPFIKKRLAHFLAFGIRHEKVEHLSD